MDDLASDCFIGNIQIGIQIGKGTHGKINEGKWEGTLVAVKEYHSTFWRDDLSELGIQLLQRYFLQEYKILFRLRHPNIVQFLGIGVHQSPGASNSIIPSLVMERLHCNLTTLLEQNLLLPVKTKLSIISDVALGLRYLHMQAPPIIHGNLSSNKILITKGMQAKIGDLVTARLVAVETYSPIIKPVAATTDFMSPEAFDVVMDDQCIAELDEGLDVFSFGCIMLHTLSHQWPSPSSLVVTSPATNSLIVKSEIERRKKYFDKIARSWSNRLSFLIERCLSNIPRNRIGMIEMCNRLDNLVEKSSQLNVPVNVLYQGMQTHDLELLAQQATKSSNDFWNKLKVTQQHCADLLVKCWPTSVTELDGKVYIVAEGSSEAAYLYAYDVIKRKWLQMPALPYHKCSLVSVPEQKQLLAIGGCKKTEDVVEVSSQVFIWDEDNKKWLIQYPNMYNARFSSSSISNGLKVIVAGGVTCYYSWTITSTVEILSLQSEISPSRTHTWTKVEQLPFAVYGAIPLIVQDNLYIAGGFDKRNHGTRKIVTAFLSELQKSNSYDASVWSRLPDLPYFSFSINHYQDHLITFTGVNLGERPTLDKPVHQFHLYNSETKSWDYIATASEGYIWGRSIKIKDDVIFVVGGTTGTIYRGEDDNVMKTCFILSFASKRRIVLHNAF